MRAIFFAVLILATQLTGCAYLYNAGNDKTAQEAKQAFAQVKLGGALEAERTTLIAQQAERQALVRRSQLALRDARLAAILNDDSNGGWANLTAYTANRLTELAGKARAAPRKNGDPKLSELQRTLQSQLNASAAPMADVQLVLAQSNSKLALSCNKQPTVIPDALKNISNLKPLVESFDDECKSVVKAQAAIAAYTSAGMLGAIGRELTAIEAAKKDVSTQIDTQKQTYQALLAQADDAKPQAGAAEDLAIQLKAALDPLEKLVLKDGKIKGNAILKHVVDEATIESLQLKKAAIDRYIAALAGADTVGADSHRLALVSDLVNRVSGKPAPPVTGMLMQAEYYRLQIEGAQKRLARAEENIALLKRKQAYLLSELGNLESLNTLLDGAKARCGKAALVAGIDGKDRECQRQASEALIQFSLAWTLGRTAAEQTDYLVIDQHELAVLDESETALKQTDAVYTAALDEVARRNAGGLKAEDISSFWQALGVTAIAIRVK